MNSSHGHLRFFELWFYEKCREVSESLSQSLSLWTDLMG